MDIIDKLIKALEETKEELSKNMNCSYGSREQNVAKNDDLRPIEDDEWHHLKHHIDFPNHARPHIQIHKKTREIFQNGSGQQWRMPEKHNLIKPKELQKDSRDPALAPKQVKVKQLQAQIDAGTYKPDSKKIADKMIKEELMCSANGQWSIKEKKK